MSNILELVQLGFHGAAVAVLILAYSLLKNWLAAAPQKPEVERLRSSAIRQYIRLCVILLSVGVAAQLLAASLPTLLPMLQGESEIKVAIQPSTMPLDLEPPRVVSSFGPAAAGGVLRTRRGELVNVELDGLTRKISQQDTDLRLLQEAHSKEADDVGFSVPR